MLEQMYWVCSDAITLASQLGTASDLPPSDVLRQRITTLFDNMRQRGRDANLAEEDVVEAQYALAAFMDEQILRSPWPERQQWMAQPLQLLYFNVNTAGEGFFERLDQLERDPRRAHVLQIYYLCLSLGFQGKYALTSPGEALAVQERAGAALKRYLPDSETISPNGYPNQLKGKAGGRKIPVSGLSVAFVAVAVVVFILLKLVIGWRADGAADEIRGPQRVSELTETTSGGLV